MKPKAFITGVSGFVGPYLVKHLAASGFEVFGIDRIGSNPNRERSIGPSRKSGNSPIAQSAIADLRSSDLGVDGCVVEKCDVTDAAAVAKVVKKVSPSLIFHLAGQSSVARSWKEPGLTQKVNVDGFRNLLDAVKSAGISPKILLVSSAEVYGIPKKLPISEVYPLAPVSPYGESKVAQEKLALAQVKEGMHIVISRSFNHTGPGQPSEFVCSNFAKQVAGIEKGSQPPVIKVGDLKVRRDFSDVRDVVKAYLLLLEKGKPGEAYNVCSGSAFTIGEVIERLARLSKVKFNVEQESSRVIDNAVPTLHGDHSKLTAATGWKPAISFDQTLADLLAYWRER